MTEDEARTKWCPMVRHIDDELACNSAGPRAIQNWNCCIASDCMMWRDEYRIGRKSTGKPLEAGQRYSPQDDDIIEIKTGGYCGLGGKP